MLRLAVEGGQRGTKKCRSQIGWQGWGQGVGRSSVTPCPGLTDDLVSEMASHSYFRVGAWRGGGEGKKKKKNVRFHI